MRSADLNAFRMDARLTETRLQLQIPGTVAELDRPLTRSGEAVAASLCEAQVSRHTRGMRVSQRRGYNICWKNE